LIKWSAGLLFALFCLEVLSRIGLSLPFVASRIDRKTDYGFRKRWLRSRKGPNNMRWVQDIYNERLGWSSIPGLRNLQVYEGKYLNTNSVGMRGLYEPDLAKPVGKTRIMLFGDSFTFGDEVSDDETYAHYLQEMLPQAEIINMGVHGYGHDQMLLLLQRVAPVYSPDLVIMGFADTDTYRNGLYFRDFAKPKFELVDGDLVLTNVPVPTPDQVLENDWKRLACLDLLGLVRHAVAVRTGSFEKNTRELTRAILKEFIESATESGAKPVIFFLPSPLEMRKPARLTRAENFIETFCQEMGSSVDYFSALPGFERVKEQGVELKKDGHWDPEGNRVVAKQVAAFLLEHGLVAPKD
jgi:hypothetical protein